MRNSNSIRKGSIVVVKEGECFGCHPGTITKVLSKPGRISDKAAILLGDFHVGDPGLVLCSNQHGINLCNNKTSTYEFISDLRPATDSEKKKFKMNNNQPIQI